MQQLDRDVFGCFMYTDTSFAVITNYLRRNKIRRFPATGSVVKKKDGIKKRSFYYALCLPGQWFLNSSYFQTTQQISTLCLLFKMKFSTGDGVNKGPLPVTEFLSAGHGLAQVQRWLVDFFLKLQQ